MVEDAREFDVVVWGATGFTGRLVASYLVERYGVGGELRWAMAGRSPAKLEAVRNEIALEAGRALDGLPLLIADAASEDALSELVSRTRVVCTTVGPYALYGSPLVSACVRHATHYCDLTGELQWMRRMIDAHQKEAVQSGARIVHTCGFDSIPSDLGVWFMQREMRARHGVTSPRVSYRARRFEGGFSGGTVASMLNMLEEVQREPEVAQILADPYALNPPGERQGPDTADQSGPRYDRDFDAWTGPFVMAGINTRVVRRTNAVLGFPYGRDFRYDEATLTGRGPLGLARASALSAGVGATMVLGRVGPLRKALARLLPGPGEGPSKETRESGCFEIDLLALHPSDPAKNLRGSVAGDRDPGYGSTAKMLGESAVCLALDALSIGGGFWTPASAMGDALLARLQERAGLDFSVIGA